MLFENLQPKLCITSLPRPLSTWQTWVGTSWALLSQPQLRQDKPTKIYWIYFIKNKIFPCHLIQLSWWLYPFSGLCKNYKLLSGWFLSGVWALDTWLHWTLLVLRWINGCSCVGTTPAATPQTPSSCLRGLGCCKRWGICFVLSSLTSAEEFLSDCVESHVSLHDPGSFAEPTADAEAVLAGFSCG